MLRFDGMFVASANGLHARFMAANLGLIAASLCVSLARAAGENSAASSRAAVSDRLTDVDIARLRAEYEAHRHAINPSIGGYDAFNPGQHWRISFDGRGFRVIPLSAGWTWGLDLISYGRGAEEIHVQSPDSGMAGPIENLPVCINAAGQRIEYQWDDNVTEWYINDSRGLEHGFTVASAPRCADNTSEPLHVSLAIRGDHRAHVSLDGRDVAFVNDAGATVITYNGLTVFDADGRSLAASFETHDNVLRLLIDDAGARYPLTIDPIAQQAYVKASNTGPGDNFGEAVAISGNTMVVGAWGESSNATGVNGNQSNNLSGTSGAAYIFVRDGATWSQQAYLKASNTGALDQFGTAVAISGDTVVVGAYQEDSNATGVNGDGANNSAANSGAAYVFVRSGTTWSQQAYLKASNTDASDEFGRSVAVSGDTIVVGAATESSNATGIGGDPFNNSASQSGAAYIFTRTAGFWSQQAYIKASNAEAGDWFGSAVAISGNTVVVGARLEDGGSTGVNGDGADNTVGQSGAAYVFFRSGTTWSQQAYLKASNTDFGDDFGRALAISSNTVVVGSAWEDSDSTGVNGAQGNVFSAAGAVYVFVRSGGVWSQQAYLKASNTESADFFGYSVAVWGDTVAVGATGESSNATGIDGNQANNSSFSSGAAYVFLRDGTTWSQQAYLKASNTGSQDLFGLSVAADGDTVAVGAPREASNATGVDGNQANNSATNSGAVYVFAGLGAPCIGFEPCDANCDGSVNPFDIGPFLELLGPSPPAPCSPCAADADGNGTINPFDISLFLDCLDA